MQKLQLSIPEPCHENWQQMTPTQQGRYCNACAKEVVDFSMMTDTEVLNYFTTPSNEKICGRALPTQLDRAITRPKEPKKRLFWYWNYIVMFFMLFSKNNGVKAQGGVKPATEFSPVKPADILKGDIVITSWVVKGKVTDKDGNPVPFATVMIKGTKTGVSTDANGGFSIKVNPGNALVISEVGSITAEVVIKDQHDLNILLEKRGQELGGLVLVAYNADDSKYTALIEVKEDGSGLPINRAKIIVTKRQAGHIDTAFSDKKGGYKLKGIKSYEHYFIKVEADGYSANEFTISGDDFKDKKKNWEVLLAKQKTEPLKSVAAIKPATETTIRMGGININREDKAALYVVDGIIVPNGDKVYPDDIDHIEVLQVSQAVALYGPQGSNGAIIITTRKAKVKDLKEVVVVSDFGTRRFSCTTGGLTIIPKNSAYKEIMASVNALLTDSIKVFPNPVQRGSSFNISLKLKQAGNLQIQIADAAGRIILQKQINAVADEYTEALPADNKWSGGVYYIRIFNNKNQLISKSSFIVR